MADEDCESRHWNKEGAGGYMILEHAIFILSAPKSDS